MEQKQVPREYSEFLTVYPVIKSSFIKGEISKDDLEFIYKKMDPQIISKISDRITKIGKIADVVISDNDKLVKSLNELKELLGGLQFEKGKSLNEEYYEMRTRFNEELTRILKKHSDALQILEDTILSISYKMYHDNIIPNITTKLKTRLFGENTKNLNKKIDNLDDQIRKFDTLVNQLSIEILNMSIEANELSVEMHKNIFNINSPTIPESNDETNYVSPRLDNTGDTDLTSGGKKSRKRKRRRSKQTKRRQRKISKKSKINYTKRHY